MTHKPLQGSQQRGRLEKVGQAAPHQHVRTSPGDVSSRAFFSLVVVVVVVVRGEEHGWVDGGEVRGDDADRGLR